MKEQTDDVTRGIEPADRIARRAQHLSLGIDLESAKRERDAANDRIGAVGRCFDLYRPVRALRGDARGAFAVDLARIELDVFATGGVVLLDRIEA